jgi:hypothetical protein
MSYVQPSKLINPFCVDPNAPTAKQMLLSAQACLIDVLCSLKVVAATLTGSKVSIYAFEFALDTAVSAKWPLANHICWNIDDLR